MEAVAFRLIVAGTTSTSVVILWFFVYQLWRWNRKKKTVEEEDEVDEQVRTILSEDEQSAFIADDPVSAKGSKRSLDDTDSSLSGSQRQLIVNRDLNQEN
eukprot:TRINITY_DN39_c0_g1_i2.p1 TRINITY_DN39_c0_g1~~TRINITY_DN39_c0_g1_i2.p1  ORF type:complete len:117 (-),score=3.89 TRINITY_DN39_c0_g1_i2:386-685(-)